MGTYRMNTWRSKYRLNKTSTFAPFTQGLQNGQLQFLYKYYRYGHCIAAGFQVLDKQPLPQILKKYYTARHLL
jgi:hypothetical protein